MSETPNPKSGGGDRAAMALIGLLFAVFFLPVLVLAGLGYWLARGRVTRREAIVIAAISAIGVVVDLSSVVGGYATWIGSFTPGSHASSWDVPVVPLLLPEAWTLQCLS